MKRDRYEVAPSPQYALAAGRSPWRLKRNGDVLCWADTQADAVDTAVRLARMRLRDHGQTAELVIKGQDGRIRDTRTYGDDPRDIKG